MVDWLARFQWKRKQQEWHWQTFLSLCEFLPEEVDAILQVCEEHVTEAISHLHKLFLKKKELKN